jgi:hypothetical protein
LSGTLVATVPSERSDNVLSDWSTLLGSDENTMQGTFVQNWNLQNFWGPQQLKITGDPLSLQR